MGLKMSGGVKTGVDYGSHLHTKPVTADVTTSKSVKGQQIAEGSKSEVAHQGVFTDGTYITVEGGRTLNLGNYESAKIGVSVTIPCNKDSLDEAYEFGTKWVSDKIDEAVKLAKE